MKCSLTRDGFPQRMITTLVALSFAPLVIAEEPVPKANAQAEYRTLIVETVYPYSVQLYPANSIVPRTGRNSVADAPEKLLSQLISSMESFDWDWNVSLWTSDSVKWMDAKDAARGISKFDWIQRWKAQTERTYEALARVEYSEYVLIEYRAIGAAGKTLEVDTVAMVKVGDRWKLTQALANDPILSGWKSIARRVQVPPSSMKMGEPARVTAQ